MTNNESEKLTLDLEPPSGLTFSLIQEEASSSLPPLAQEEPQTPPATTLSLVQEEQPAAPAAPEKKELPPIDPTASLEAFPAVLKKIQGMWATNECDQFLHSLFMDTRGGTRRGFPMEAADEIMFLVKFNKTVRAIPLTGQMHISFAEAFRVVDQADQKRLTQGVSDVWGATGVAGEAPARPGRSQEPGPRATSRPRGKQSKASTIVPWIIILVLIGLAYKLLLPVFIGGGPNIGG